MEYRYYLDKKDSSLYPMGSLVSASDFTKKNRQLSGAQNWQDLLNGIETDLFVSRLPGTEECGKPFTRDGIAFEFSKLKHLRDIHAFATNYGLLGIAEPSIATHIKFKEAKTAFGESAFLLLEKGYSDCEPIEVWFFYINQIQKILKLYKALVSIHAKEMSEKEIEVNILNIGAKIGEEYLVEWWDGSFTGYTLSVQEAEKGDFLQMAKEVLIALVNKQGNQNINSIVSNVIKTNKPPLGFVIEEHKYTDYLISAIYYDVWQLISRNEPVHICKNDNCKLPFKKVKRQIYCSNACKQEAYRNRKKKGGK